MTALANEVIARLGRSGEIAELLTRAGDPDPAAAATHFATAAATPELAGCFAQWVPALLTTARPGFGAAALTELASAARTDGTPIELAKAPLLPALLGNSNVLARLLQRHPEWCDALRAPLPEAPAAEPVAADWDAIRAAKYRGLLRVAARDIAGRPFRESFDELSALADRCLTAALDASADAVGVAPPALFALGKLGGAELNFSSDVDVLFVHEPPADGDAHTHHAAVVGLIERFKQGLEQPTPDGFGYRVDLDLRPEGRAGGLANSVDAALTYYESFGAEWERQMLIRLRPVAGDPAAAERFAREITPFVYRRALASDVLREVRSMKERIEAERRSAGRDLEADLKEGPGGIRDVEFLVQWLQLFHGGREPGLRTGNVLEALSALGSRGLLPEATAAALGDAYLWLRRAEHALQLAEEQQTQRFPRRPADQTALARRMGYAEEEADEARTRLLDDWTSTRTEVRGHFEALVLRETD